MPAPPQIVGVPGSMSPLEERVAVAYAMGARTPEEMATQMVKTEIYTMIFLLVVLAIVFIVFWFMGKEVPIHSEPFTEKPRDESPDHHPFF
jgi:zona occludens toxin (predicted ATPase)